MLLSGRIGGIYVQKKRLALKVDLSTIGKNLRQCQRTSTEERSAAAETSGCFGEIERSLLISAVAILDL
jgi:hypothetical protein